MKLRPLSYRKISKILIKLGFKPLRQRDSHVFFKHDDGRTTVVPNHPGEDIGRGLIKKILRDANTSVEDFLSKL